MNAVVDRIVQYANRYKLTDVSTGKVLGVFDFDEVTGTVQQVGTEINKELFDSIANDLATRLVANGGDSKDLIVTFTEATSVENISSKEKHSTIFGKIAKWFTDRISKLKKFTYDSATKITSTDIDGTIPTKDALENGDITVMNAEYANSASRATADKNGKDITTYVAKETDPTVPGWAKNATKPTYTKAEVGLGNVDNTADLDKPISTATQNALNEKVDKVSGKGLSTNDYTSAEKNKLAGLATDTVRYGEQSLTQAQKSQARSNIGAGTSDFDGTWNSLSGKPNVVQSTGKSTSDVMSQNAVTNELNKKANSADLAIVATSGSYNDLQNIPTDIAKIGNLSNPNLLINPNFAINQRGQTSYTTDGYTVDRWRLTDSGGTVTPTSKGIRLTSTNSWQGLNQYIENYKQLDGQTVTLSIKIASSSDLKTFVFGLRDNDGTIVEKYYAPTETAGIYTVTTTIPSKESRTQLRIFLWSRYANQVFDIEWAKLEIGSVATEFSPPNIAEELPKCQRYYQNCRLHGCSVTASTTTSYYPSVPIPVSMRVKPTITVTQKPNIRGYGINYAMVDTDSIEVYAINDNMVTLAIVLSTAKLTASQVYALANGQAAFDAEI